MKFGFGFAHFSNSVSRSLKEVVVTLNKAGLSLKFRKYVIKVEEYSCELVRNCFRLNLKQYSLSRSINIISNKCGCNNG